MKITPCIIAVLSIGLLADTGAAKEAKQNIVEWSVVKIVDFEGNVTFESMGTKQQQKSTRGKKNNQRNQKTEKFNPIQDRYSELLKAYNEAAKEYNRKAKEWARQAENAGKTFGEFRPVKPSVTILRSRIKNEGDAQKIAEATTKVWEKNQALAAEAKAKAAEREAERLKQYREQREAALQREKERKERLKKN